ncbi:MBOAT family O-acyltransferase [Butyrivibrio sp. AE3003]|uniref:MBOAT family O-acyltransferase n=1 Tax=Butyrivibrio sp. AE3003 TaxID=1496721 RepID=UPI00047E6508|nr:MBOAT family O-acyltransferase [Butyrivibrio sp. AE3003]
MQFSSGVFLMLFLPITIGIYKCGGSFLGHGFKNIILLIFSMIFYAWGEPLYIFVLIFGICINYYLGIEIERGRHKKAFLAFSLIFNLGNLFIFKYLSFVTRELYKIIPIKVVSIALPIGISFYSFQIMSYIFDVYYEKVPAQKNILNLALYISMFPQLVAGPIVRYSDIEKEINERSENSELFYQGTQRFIIGLAKKVLVADFLGGIADKIFITAEYSDIPMLTAWIGAISYTFEIYYDFSGYSDMAIGLGKCFGFHFKENFNYPYISCSITEFWRRWHISLTDWFRDYVYIPLGGNRVSSKRHIFNLFIVWLLTGVWHGANWTFILWGMMYFIIQLFEKKTKIMDRIPKVLGYVITMIIVTIGWTIFKAKNLINLASFLAAMFGYGDGIIDSSTLLYFKSSVIILSISFIGSFPIVETIEGKFLNPEIKVIKELVWLPLSVVLLGFCLLVIINGSYSPFIYFNF